MGDGVTLWRSPPLANGSCIVASREGREYLVSEVDAYGEELWANRVAVDFHTGDPRLRPLRNARETRTQARERARRWSS